MSMQDARFTQLRTSAYAAANAIVKQKETLGLSREQLEALSNTVSERSNSEKNPALQSNIRKLVEALSL